MNGRPDRESVSFPKDFVPTRPSLSPKAARHRGSHRSESNWDRRRLARRCHELRRGRSSPGYRASPLIFVLAGILAFEIGVIHLNITRQDINRVGRIYAWYGICALVIIVVGFLRAIFAAKGWGYCADHADH
jgi:hypothetical protein